jgi:hypothetical protein
MKRTRHRTGDSKKASGSRGAHQADAQGLSNRLDGKETDNEHQKTVQGKNQRGPDGKMGRDAGGNEGSRGQNVSRQGSRREEASGKQSRES